MKKTAPVFWSLMLFCISAAAGCNGRTILGPGSEQMLVSVTMTFQDLISRPVPGVRVEITNGTDAGTYGLSGADGVVTVAGHTTPLGPFGLLQVRITKEGFKTETREFQAQSFDQKTFSATVSLTSEASLDLSGEYSMTIEADSACQDLPEEVRRRTYHATLAHQTFSATSFSVRLSGATFFRDRANLGSASAGADVARFQVSVFLGSDDEDALVEQLGTDEWVAIQGDGKTVASQGGAVLSGPLSGTFSYCPATPTGTSSSFACPVPAVSCKSSAHQLTLTRQ